MRSPDRGGGKVLVVLTFRGCRVVVTFDGPPRLEPFCKLPAWPLKLIPSETVYDKSGRAAPPVGKAEYGLLRKAWAENVGRKLCHRWCRRQGIV